ncbi:UvrD-helicase domain-containing protein, partial [Alicyclobacillus cellulosilyticus]|uniref:UvrD-helicase domain-containing protein n=1 Tax=Alicyclobacillus cellulosilyticus TaxID=1003997 RepID=UPI001666CDF2
MSADPQTQWSLAQRQAIEQRGADMLVSAGAGSGKTTVLVERVLRCLVEDGHDLTQLLIVTFTEAAAAEMRDRIRQRLMQALADARARNEEALARRMYRQLALLEQARISTLHSFCLDMVRRHFLRLGLEPGFRILEDDEAQLLRAELLQACLEEALAKDDPRFWRMLARFQAEDPARWFPLVEQVAAFARSQPDPCGWLRGVADRFTAEKHASDPLAPWRPAVFAWVSHHLAAARRQADDGAALAARDATLKKYAEALVQAAQALGSALQAAAACDWDGVLAAAAAAAAELDRRVRAGDSPWKEEVKAARARAKEAVRTVLEVLSRPQAEWAADIRELAPDVAAFVDFVTAFMASYQARKRRLGAVDFHDLEHFALAVLQDPESGEALRLRDEIVQVFVDEYQDISPIQDAILRAVARPGSLFVVGDVKQSIYRFRMAEPRLFLSAYETLSGGRGGVVVDLQDNYRSRPEVVAAVNFLFAQWFTRGFGGLDYDERARMRAGRKADDAPGDALGGAVEVHVIERNGAGDAEEAVADVDADAEVVAQEDDGSAADRDAVDGDAAAGGGADREALAGEDLAALEREAALVAWQIQHWMGRLPGSARRQVWDKELRRYRPLCWRDIVILLRSAAGRMNRVLEVLARAGIPAYGVTSSGFYEALEVRWLLSALAAIDNPRREIELVALMRSPMFAFTDVDLAQIRLAARGNYFDAVAQAARGAGVHAELAARCRGFLAQLDAWRTLARRAGAEAVLRQVLADTGLWSYLTGMPGGLARRANVELLLDRARWFDRTSVDGVFGFVAFAARALAAELDTGEARALGEHEDVVRVMTIHKSKGLEFPVVFVMDLGKQFRLSSRGSACLLHRDLGLGPQCVDEEGVRRWKSLPYIAIEHAERTESLAEEARILYVAMTRARDKLVLVGSCRDARRQVERARAVADASGGKPLPVDVMVSARTYLDWLLPAVVRCVSPDAAQAALLSLCVWDDTQPLPAAGTGTMVGAAAAAAGDLTGLYRALRAAAGDAGGQPLPAG